MPLIYGMYEYVLTKQTNNWLERTKETKLNQYINM